MKNWIAIALLFVATFCWPQFVTITGTVTDGTCSYANGTGRVVLSPQNQQWLVNGTNPVQSPIPINGLDSFGRFSIQLTNTSLITPASANPQWQFSFCSQSVNGQQPACFSMTPLSLTTSQDISVQILAQAAPIQNCSASAITGSGSMNVVTKWTGTTAIGNTGISEYSSPPIWDSPSGFWQLQADSGAGVGVGGVLNLQSTNGPFAAAAASLTVGSNGIQIDANQLLMFTAGGKKTVITGPGAVQFGDLGGTKGSVNFVGNSAGTQSVGCLDSTCSDLAVSSLVISDITGSTQCLNVSTTGQVSGTGSPCGTGSGLTGSGVSGIYPIWTGTSSLGDSNISNVAGPPAGINYSLGGGLSWQIDASHITFNSAVAGSGNIIIANTYAPGTSNNSGGVIVQAAPATGSACAGGVAIKGGATNGTGNNASVTANGGCSNGFGATGADISIAAGGVTTNNAGGNVLIVPGTSNSVIGTTKISHGLGGGSGFQHKRVSSCTTAGSAGDTCTTTVTWSPAFDSTNYTAACVVSGGTGAVTGTPYVLNTSSKTVSQITVTIAALTAAASAGTLDCIGVHD